MKGRRTNKQKQNPKGFCKQLMKCANDILVSSNIHRRSMIRGIGKLRDKSVKLNIEEEKRKKIASHLNKAEESLKNGEFYDNPLTVAVPLVATAVTVYNGKQLDVEIETEETMNSGSALDSEESILEAKKKLYHKNKYAIYAFVTDKVKGFIKIGFTGDIRRRISEWKKIYGEDGFELLCPEEGWPCELFFEGVKKYFPDHVVHDVIEGHRQFKDYHICFRRIKREEFQADVYVSKEFFERFNKEGEELTAELIGNIVRDLRDEFITKGCGAQCGTLYDFITKKEIDENKPKELARFSDLPIQTEAIDYITDAFKNKGVTKFLLAAVMRFGKTYSTFRVISNCKFKRVVITSVKGETRVEFRKGFMHKDFLPDTVFVEIFRDKAFITGDVHHKAKENIANGNFSTDDYYWHVEINSDNLEGFSESDGIVKWCEENGLNLIFYDTLQDMYGESGTGKIKDKHIEFSSKFLQWNLKVIDETHDGFRGEKMGKAFEENFSSEYRLDLSGTPYVILESGEFDKKGTDSWIVTYEDIEQARENWGINHPDEPEYNNPLYGTVRRHYIIVKPTKKIVEMFGGALTPDVISKIFPDASGECEFEDALTELFERLFGSIGNGFNGLINMKDGSECNVLKHIMIKLPNDASCHYMRELFKKHNIADDRNLIVATDCTHDGKYKGKKCDTCADNSTTLNTYLWKECEEKNRGSIIFTCDRFMTASTLDLVDGVFLCGGDVSTQTVDQATGRPLTRAVLPVVDANGNECGGKYTLKTDVYIFDFCISRMCKVVASAVKMLKRSAEQRGVQNILSQKEYRDVFFKWNDMSILTDSLHEVNAINFLQIQKQALMEEGAAIINRIATSSLYAKICEKHPEFKDICRIFSSGKVSKENGKQLPYYDTPNDEEVPVQETEEKNNKPENSKGTKESPAQKTNKEDKDQNLIEGLKNMVIRLIWTALFVKEHIVTLSSYCETVKKYHKVMSAFGFSEYILNRLSLIFKDDDIEAVHSEIDRIQSIMTSKDSSEKIDCINQVTSLILFSENEIKTPSWVARIILNYVLQATTKQASEIKILNPFDKDGVFAEVALSLGYNANNIYSICTSEAAHQIVKLKFELLGIPDSNIFNDSYGFDSNDFINNKECKTTLKGMKFDATVGNPPYNKNKQQIYTKFYLTAREIANVVSMIFPRKWQQPNSKNLLGLMNTKHIKEDRQIVFIDNRTNVFENVQGADETNIILWKRDYDNGLNGMQLILTEGENPKAVRLKTEDDISSKPAEIQKLAKCIEPFLKTGSMEDITSRTCPYGLRKTGCLKDPEHYGYEKNVFSEEKIPGGYRIFWKVQPLTIRYVENGFNFKRMSENVGKYRVLVGTAWGNFNKKSKYYSGTYAPVIIANPYDVCSETFQESGSFDTKEEAIKHAKHILTPVVRACLCITKHDQMTNEAWANVPKEDYSEDWWDEDIETINHKLCEKYGIPKDVEDFLLNRFEPKSINDILSSL